jgi:hypothetical protein
MKISRKLLIFAVLSQLVVRSAQAQTGLIIQKDVIVSRTLSGHANIGLAKEVAMGITVELCNSDWKAVLASTKTDDNGYFSMEKPPGKLFYLRFSSPGVNPFRLKVRISKHAAHDLTIHLSIAT